MSAEVIKFDPLVVLNARWHALDAQIDDLLDRGEGRPIPDWARLLRCTDGEPARYLMHDPGRVSAR